MEQFEVECLVIGAGVVGLAVARALAKQGKAVLLVEQEAGIGMQTSSRNSEVIHAGIYYPQASLKATLCVRGRHLLYQYCDSNNVPYRRCGKLIVAKDESQAEGLRKIQQHALKNGVDDIVWLAKDQVLEKEPSLDVHAALFSPSTGIIDSHAYMLQLQADFESFGGQCAFNTRLSLKEIKAQGFEFNIQGESAVLRAKECVNSAGLSAISLFEGGKGFPEDCLPQAHFAKGSYFSYSGKMPFRHLIYPMPEQGGLGVHLTLDLAGSAKFGPDVDWLTQTDPEFFDYQVDETKRSKFEHSIRQYWPGINATKLVPDYSGIRPKVSGPEEAPGDFIIQGSAQHGVVGLVNLFGIESPGLTSSLAIAEQVQGLLSD